MDDLDDYFRGIGDLFFQGSDYGFRRYELGGYVSASTGSSLFASLSAVSYMRFSSIIDSVDFRLSQGVLLGSFRVP